MTSRQLNVRKHLQQISIRITEEQRAMSKDLVSGRREQTDALPQEFVGALIDFGSGNLEGQLKRGAAVGRWSIYCSQAWPRKAKVLPPTRYSIQPGESSRNSGKLRMSS